MRVEIEIDRTHLGLLLGRHLLFDLCGAGELLLQRSMQPPVTPTPHERRTSHLVSQRHFPPAEPTFEPTPTRARPDFEQDASRLSILPLARVKRGGLVPPTRGDGWTLMKRLALGLGLFLLCSPFLEMGKEGTGGTKSRMKSRTAQHGRHV